MRLVPRHELLTNSPLSSPKGLIKSYPDITTDQLVCLFSLREDMNKMNIKKVSAFALKLKNSFVAAENR